MFQTLWRVFIEHSAEYLTSGVLTVQKRMGNVIKFSVGTAPLQRDWGKATDNIASKSGLEEWEVLWWDWNVLRKGITSGRQQVAKIESALLLLAMIKTARIKFNLLLQTTIELDKICATNVSRHCTTDSLTFIPAFCLEVLPKPVQRSRAPT